MTNEEIIEKITDHSNRIKVSEHRIENVEIKIDKIEALTLSVQKLALSVEQMAKEQMNYCDTQKEINSRLMAVEQYPIKEKASRHDKIAGQVATLVIGAFVGYLIKTFFGI